MGYALLAACFAVLTMPAAVLGRQGARPAPGAQPTVQDLVLAGKVPAAVTAALRTPDGGAAALKALLDRADAQITDRQIAEARATLAGAEKFLAAYAKKSRKNAPAREPLDGRKLRLEGIELSDAKEYAKAEGVLRRALEISRKAGDAALEAGVHNNLGHSLRVQQKYREAIQELTAARDSAEGARDNPRAGSYNFNLGLAQYQSGNFEPAYGTFKRAAEQNRLAGRESIQARSLLWQGRSLSAINAVSPEPVKYMAEAQKLFGKLGDHANSGWSYFYIADHTAYSFDWKKASLYGEAAAREFEAADEREGRIKTYNLLADMFARSGEPEKSESYRKKAMELSAPQRAK